MARTFGTLLAMFALTGCGADGEPVRPAISTTVGAGSQGGMPV